MDRLECYLVVRAPRAREALRRFTYGDPSLPNAKACPALRGGHDASVTLGEVPWERTDIVGLRDDDLAHDDPRWPARCACGYEFEPGDPWQHVLEQLWARGAGGDVLGPTDELPAGAMYDAEWLRDCWPGPDGRSLVLVLPDGVHWTMDVPARDGAPWQRTGEPPRVTANPSILSPNYHGWLRAGVLERC